MTSKAISFRRIPEFVEMGLHEIGQLFVFACAETGNLGEIAHDAQRIVPEGTDLNWFANARRHDPQVDFGIHPCQLYAGEPP